MTEQEWTDTRANLGARIAAAIAYGRGVEVAYLTPADRAYVERDLVEHFDTVATPPASEPGP